MWNLVRMLLVALALVGFVGLGTAHATPFQVFEATGGTAEMDCAAVAAPVSSNLTIQQPVVGRVIAFLRVNVSRDGAEPDPLVSPPASLTCLHLTETCAPWCAFVISTDRQAFCVEPFAADARCFKGKRHDYPLQNDGQR